MRERGRTRGRPILRCSVLGWDCPRPIEQTMELGSLKGQVYQKLGFLRKRNICKHLFETNNEGSKQPNLAWASPTVAAPRWKRDGTMIYIYIYIYLSICVYIYIYRYRYEHISRYVTCVYVRVCACVCVYIYIYIHIHTHQHITSTLLLLSV